MELPITLPHMKPTIFLSSQIGVFKEERRRLADMIEQELDLVACRFEGLSRPHPPREVYQTYIEQSQLFVGIYGEEYGWIDEKAGMQISGIHDEWRIATARDMPRLAFVRTSTPKDPRLQEMIDKEIRSISYVPFSTSDELVQAVKQSLQQLLRECIFAGLRSIGTPSPDYAGMLVKQYETQFIIETSFVIQGLRPLLDRSIRVFLYGPPGCGKTVCLMLLAKSHNCIYVSLRNKSLLGVLTYIANRAAKISHLDEHHYSSIDSALAACERNLCADPLLVLIDEADQNIEVAKALFTLNSQNSRIVFAGRIVPFFLDAAISTIKCSGFSNEEAEAFTAKLATRSDVKRRQEAIAKSAGNPQYLAYYCMSRDEDPAATLDLYHARIYQELSPSQREIMALLSTSETLFSVTDLAKALSAYRKTNVTGIAAQDELRSVAHVVAHIDGMLTVFHPAFAEHVRAELRRVGLAQDIHRALAGVYDARAELPFAVFHKVCAGEGDTVYDSLPSAEDTAYLTGFMRVARRLYADDIRISKANLNLHRLGYALYHVSLLRNHSVGSSAGLRVVRLAEEAFVHAGESEWIHITRATGATFLVGLDRGDEAIAVLRGIADHAKQEGLVHLEVLARTNLAFVYAKMGRIDDTERESLWALELAEAGGDLMGVAICLLNLNNAHVAKGDSEKVLKTCRELQRLARQLDMPRLEAGALNGLTAYYRRKGRYADAEEAARKSMDIAKRFGDWDCLATNMGNLGNVYRDQGNTARARECYEAVLEIGERRHMKAHIAHGMTSLADLADAQEDYVTSIELGSKALSIWLQCGNRYRIAVTTLGQAERILSRSGFDWQKTMPLFNDAAKGYFDVGLYSDASQAYLRLIEVLLDHGAKIEASRTIIEALSRFAAPTHSHYFCRLLGSLGTWDSRAILYIDTREVVRVSLQCLSSSMPKADLFELIRTVTAVLKRFDRVAALFSEFFHGLAAKYVETPSEYLAVGLAMAIEQVPASVTDSALTGLFRELGTLDAGLIYRNEPWLDDQWFVVFDAPNAPMVEIQSLKTTNTRVVAAVTALLLWAERTVLMNGTKRAQWTSIGWLLQGLDEQDARKEGAELPPYFPARLPVYLATAIGEDGPAAMTGMITSSTYLSQADYLTNPDSRSLIILNIQLTDSFLRNFVAHTFGKRRAARLRRKLITHFFDVEYIGRNQGSR
jgi:tetratricopeptide (TPR) repeat protein